MVEEAKARGISVEALVRHKIEAVPDAAKSVSPTSKRFGPGTKTPEEAVESILEMRKRYTLNDAETEDALKHDIVPMTPAEAGAGLREMRKRYTLGGTVTIKQLIEGGRRYWVAAFVLDASATLACCFEDEASPFSDRLTGRMEFGEEVVVPAHWPVEFLSALQQGRRRRRIDEAGLAD